MAVMTPSFRPDLYRGTSGYYERFRRAYPPELIDDLAARTGADGTGRLADLACGTGQVCFALSGRFAEIWAVDSEPGMIAVAREKASAIGSGIRWRIEAATVEELSAPDGAFDLVTIGNAFHRLRRDAVAARVARLLRPGGFVALLWGGSPTDGHARWQQALRDTMRGWQERPGADERVPAEYESDRTARPDQEILRAAGFEIAGRQQFPVSQLWTADQIAGFVASTSVLSPEALGEDAAEFDADLRRALQAAEPGGEFRQATTFAFDLARRPG